MRSIVLGAIFVLAAAFVFAGQQVQKEKSSPAFDKLKSLAGTWKGKDESGNPVTATYKVVSAGSAIMETLDMGKEEDAMITMYHPDGDVLMLTHYCSMGNQPRMKAASLSKDGKTLNFDYVDATNLATPDQNRMHGLKVTFKDQDHFSQEWTMLMDGKSEHHARFEYERVK